MNYIESIRRKSLDGMTVNLKQAEELFNQWVEEKVSKMEKLIEYVKEHSQDKFLCNASVLSFQESIRLLKESNK